MRALKLAEDATKDSDLEVTTQAHEGIETGII